MMDPWVEIEKDEFYKQFINVDSIQKDNNLSNDISVTEKIKKLTEGINKLDKELKNQVLENHQDLLSQATWVEKLEIALETMQAHVQSILSGIERLRIKIEEPYNKISKQNIMLERLHETSDLLRRISRIQQLAKRLSEQIKVNNILKASQIINELSQISEDIDLSGLDILDNDLTQIRNYRKEIDRQTKHELTQGLLKQDHNQIYIAIQVFHNLGTLDQVVNNILQNSQNKLEKAINSTLDPHNLSQVTESTTKSRAPGRSSLPQPGNSNLFRSRLWNGLEQLLDQIIAIECLQIISLEQVLRRKSTDRISLNITFKDTIGKTNVDISIQHWNIANKLLGKNLIAASTGSNFVKKALEGEYPKFLRLYLDLCKKLQNAIKTVSNEDENEFYPINEELNIFSPSKEILSNFENGYLSRSVSRLLDPVHIMFSTENLPKNEEIDTLTRTISSELSVSLVDSSLSKLVAKNVHKTVRLFGIKCEQLICTSGEATQVIDAPTPGQSKNVTLANLLYYFAGQVGRVINNMGVLSPDCAQLILESLENADKLTENNILNPLLGSISDAIQAIILTIHNEDYSYNSNDPRASNGQTSLYMKELQGFIARVSNSYLAPFTNQNIVKKCCVAVINRSVELFMRHTCLVKPLGEGGREKILNDYNQMETCLAPLAGSQREISLLCRSAARCRVALFAQSTPQLGVSEDIGQESTTATEITPPIPFSLALIGLFSRGPSELVPPHQCMGWSIGRLSRWLDDHTTERERLELCRGALERYRAGVSEAGQTSFHPLYPLMVALFDAGIRSIQRQ